MKYYTKDSASAAMKRLKGHLNIEPAHVKNPGKNVQGAMLMHDDVLNGHMKIFET